MVIEVVIGNHKKTSGMGMPDETQLAIVLFHLVKMTGELSCPCIEFLPETR